MAEEKDDSATSEVVFDAMDHFPLPSKPLERQEGGDNLAHDPNHLAVDSSVSVEPVRLRRRRHRSSSSHPPTSSTSREISSFSGCRAMADSAASGIGTRRIDVGDVDYSFSISLLVAVGRLLIKLLDFEFRLLISFVILPFRFLRFCFMLATEPFGVMSRMRNEMSSRIVGIVDGLRGILGSAAVEWVCRRKPVVVRMAWGCFWSLYVGFILVGCLLTSLLVGRLVMHYVVEGPIWIRRELGFDYTIDSPVAVVPITPCDGSRCHFGCEDVGEVPKSMKARKIPPHHKLRLNILLTLPESAYNQNLGIFQVKVQFLTANGKVSASSSRPCMLRYKSFAIRYLETTLKSGPILAGYLSESQIANVKMDGLTEGMDPTVCIRVTIERRAEYKPGYGIPELYAASIEIESELPLFKKIIWSWRKTIFIWISTSLLIFELLFILVCCKPFLIPRVM